MNSSISRSDLEETLRVQRDYADIILRDNAAALARESQLHTVQELLYELTLTETAHAVGQTLADGVRSLLRLDRAAVVSALGTISEFADEFGVGFSLTPREDVNLSNTDVTVGNGSELDTPFYESEGQYAIAPLLSETGAPPVYLYVDGYAGKNEDLEANISTIARFAAVIYQNVYYRAALEKQSLTDAMTGAANRRAYDDRINEWVVQGRTFLHFLVDLDNFKEINDTRGHEAGDDVIRATVRALKSVVRDTDMVARIGGDEFTVICDAEPDQMGPRIRTALRVERINASIGLAISPQDGTTADEIKKASDVAMYEEKKLHHSRRGGDQPKP